MMELTSTQNLLHPWVRSNPAEKVKFLQTEEYRLNLISKIFFAAIAVISVTVIASSFIFTSVSLAIALPLTSSVIITPCLAWASSQFQAECQKVRQIIERELPVAKTYEKIENYSPQEILDFLNKNNIFTPASIEVKELLPVIARFLSRQEESLACFEKAQTYLKASGISSRELRLHQRNLGWDMLEKMAIPLAIEGAFALHVLKNPFSQETPSMHFHLLQKSFEERQFDQIFGPKDPYLTFLTNKREPLHLEVLISHKDPRDLYNLLFPI